MIKFGTSGFRGIMGDSFTKAKVQKVAEALVKIIEKKKIANAEIAIGYDNRFMSKEYAQWMSEVLCKRTTVYFFTSSTPSPVLAWIAKKINFTIAITASHNPYMYNGIKIFLSGARECDDEFANNVERIANSINIDEVDYINYQQGVNENRIIETNNYIDYCDSLLTHFNTKIIKKSKLKVLINPMHGNSVNCFRYLLEKLKIDYVMQNDDIDPYFEYKLPAPYVHNLTKQAKEVVKGGYDLGFALDGDSDRFTLIGSNGKIYDCNYVAAVLYYYCLKYKNYKGAIVKNIASSNLLKRISESFNFNCYDAKVGFKHIGKILEETDAFIGIESNGIAFKEHILTKDGIFVGIAILELIAFFKKPFHEILKEVQKEYNFENTVLEFAYPISKEKKSEIIDLLFVKKEYPKFHKKIIDIDEREGLKINYENDYWGMIRFSGNEPVVRIFSEMKNKKECDKMFACYEKFLGLSQRQ